MNILITGTSKGLGKYLFETYSKENNVYGCSRTKSSTTNYCLDVTDEKSVIEMVNSINRVDVLINNAAIASMNPFVLTPTVSVKKIYDINFIGSFIISREVIKKMIHQKYGRIINISTIATALNLEGELIYATSKAAIEKMTQILSKEIAGYGITVNCVAPTPLEDGLIKGTPKEKINSVINLQSIKRQGKFEDVKKVIDFFIDNEFITGQIIYMGGICKS